MSNFTTPPPTTHENAYGYDPSKGLAIAGCVVFATLAIALLVETIILRKRWYMIAVVIGCTAEAIGYAVRRISANNPGQLGLAITTILFILLAPIVIALGAYLTVAHIAKKMRDKSSLINPKVFEIAFITADVVSFLIQGAGGAMLAKNDIKSQNRGKAILIFGLSLALISFTIFLVLTVYVQLRTRSASAGQRWRRIFIAVYTNAVCLIVRSAYRLIEFASGRKSWVATHEVLFYTLDALPMIIAVLAWLMIHPAMFKVGSK